MKKILIFFFAFLSVLANANLIVINQNTKLFKKWKTEIIYEVKTLNPIHILIDYYEPVTYSNSYLSWDVKEDNSIIKGDFQINNIVTENYKLLRILTTMSKNFFFMNKSYSIISSLDLTSFIFNDYNPEIKTYNLKNIKFLNQNQLDYIINYLSNLSIINRIFETLLFIKKSVSLNSYNFATKNNDIAVFLNSLAEAYRVQGIKSRIVHGYSIPAKYRIRYDGNEVVLIYPRGQYHWIELFIPNLGWLPIDPFLNLFFFVPNNLIVKSYSDYFLNNLDMMFIYPKKPDFLFTKETIFSEDEYSEVIIFGQKISDLQDFIISAPIQIGKIELSKKVFNSRKFFIPKQLGLFENNLKVDMEITEDRYYYQDLFFETKTRITKVILPLYFLELTKSGRVWVEVINKGKTYKSIVLSTPYKDLSNEYLEYVFTFTSPIELEGKVSVVLKIANISAVFWYAIIGDIIGIKDDTFSNDGRVMNIDFCIRME